MPRRTLSRARAVALLGGAGLALAGGPASTAAAAPAGWILRDGAARQIDSGLSVGCIKTLAAGRAAAFCDSAGRAGGAIAVRGSVARPLVPGRKLTLRAPRASRRAQLALIYRSGGKTTYLRFQGFGRGRKLRAVVTSRASGDSLIVRMAVGGRTFKPIRKARPGAAPEASPPAADPPAPAPRTFPGIEAVPGRTCGALPSVGDAAYNALFATCGPGWTGGDATYSVPLPDGRVAWIFSDSFLGGLADDGTRTSATFVHNSIVLQDGNRLTTVHGGSEPTPGSVFSPADPGHFYWTGDGTVEGNRLHVFLFRHHLTGGGAWDFAYDDGAIATVSLPDMRVESVVALPNHGVAWGAAVLETAGWTYVYGVEEQGGDKHVHVARARQGDLRGAWQYWDGGAWTADPARSARVASGVSNQFSVVPHGGGYALVTLGNGLSRDVRAYLAAAPEGPWGAPQTIARIPEQGAGRWGYNAVLHPQAGDQGGLLLSYNVNSENPGEIWRDATTYRPRFLRVTLPPAP